MKTLLLLLLSCIAAPAQLAIYNFSAVMSITGRGNDISPRITGVLIIDLGNLTAYRVGRARVNGAKLINKGEENNLVAWSAIGKAASTRTLLVSGFATNTPSGYTASGMHYIGKDSPVIIAGQTFYIPRSFKGAGYAVNLQTNLPAAKLISTTTASHTFSGKATDEANAASETLEATAQRYLALYRAQGYLD